MFKRIVLVLGTVLLIPPQKIQMVSCSALDEPNNLGPSCSSRDSEYPRDCSDAYNHCDGRQTESEIIWIKPEGSPEPFMVHCNNSVDGGGWTVFQRRIDGLVNFHRPWSEYKNGFGFLQREFWLGNDKLSYLTNQGDYVLRVDLIDSEGGAYFAKYRSFRISDEFSDYKIYFGAYLPESTAHNSLVHHNGKSFTTYDNDNDFSGGNCAVAPRSAWWYNACDNTDLNADYFGPIGSENSIEWDYLPGGHYNLKFTEMKVRRVV